MSFEIIWALCGASLLIIAGQFWLVVYQRRLTVGPRFDVFVVAVGMALIGCQIAMPANAVLRFTLFSATYSTQMLVLLLFSQLCILVGSTVWTWLLASMSGGF